MDLFSHFQVQALLAGVGFAAVFAVLRAPRRAALSALCACYAFWQISGSVTWHAKAGEHFSAGPTISVVAANLFGSAQALNALEQRANMQSADLAILTELPAHASNANRLALLHLPYLAGRPNLAGPGQPSTVILSAWPPKEQTLVKVGRNPAEIVRARYCPDGLRTCFSVFALHPLPPLSPRFYDQQEAILARLSVELDAADGPVIVAGDFNATPWSPLFKRLLRSTGLERVDCGGFLRPTWLSTTPGLGLPLDHILLRGDIVETGCAVGPLSGSDHAPVRADLNLMVDD
ncbi:endonuclease/exonuclease/phosphatase family protein [Roseibium hamelinense]|nr:endonuclease/exonuclease/phosphatase family protein [Roseibium hamelinense]MTI45493.1 endonuclease/exonuclease/phosphatase family protein [Roseibium hamelinense]